MFVAQFCNWNCPGLEFLKKKITMTSPNFGFKIKILSQSALLMTAEYIGTPALVVIELVGHSYFLWVLYVPCRWS